MDILKFDTDVDFRRSLINILVKEINELSLCTYPIVTQLEIVHFISDIANNLNERISTYKQKYGSNHMEEVFYFVKEYCIKRYFNEILKYVNYPKKNFEEDNKTIDKE